MFIDTISPSPNFKKVLRKTVTLLVALLTTCQASRNIKCIALQIIVYLRINI
jgi:hypothetical protein